MFVRSNPGIAKKSRYSSAGSKTEEFLHSLNPNQDLESVARDEDEIVYPVRTQVEALMLFPKVSRFFPPVHGIAEEWGRGRKGIAANPFIHQSSTAN